MIAKLGCSTAPSRNGWTDAIRSALVKGALLTASADHETKEQRAMNRTKLSTIVGPALYIEVGRDDRGRDTAFIRRFDNDKTVGQVPVDDLFDAEGNYFEYDL